MVAASRGEVVIRGATVNYVLCAWSGERRVRDPRYLEDRAFYLREHFAALASTCHSLDQITVMVPHNPDEPETFRRFLEALPDTVGTARVVVRERLNRGLSYGSLSDCFAEFGAAFDFYILMEDDYVLVPDDFDDIHLRVMEKNPRCGYLCGLIWDLPPHHAAVANGMLRADALRAVWTRYGKLPHAADSGYSSNESGGQEAQSVAIVAAGFNLLDWTGRYRVVFRNVLGHDVVFHDTASETMMRPI